MSYHFFWDGNTPFSQWYRVSFVEDGIVYSSSEQYMMYKKAKLFGDERSANEILATPDPKRAKAIGRAIANFDERVWEQNRARIVEQGNYLKFSQNPVLKELIRSFPADTIFVEASPYDRVWGIGFSADTALPNKERWGANLLGRILGYVKRRV
jgi:ribA/ribD-fused uncharacterized protein